MDRDKAMWLEDHFQRLQKTGMVYPNLHTRFGSEAMVVPKKATYRMVADYGAVNSLIESNLGYADAEPGGDGEEDGWSQCVLHARFVAGGLANAIGPDGARRRHDDHGPWCVHADPCPPRCAQR